MAKVKGKAGTPRWDSPAAADIKPGDRLHYYSVEYDFEFEVLSLQHKGEWIFGWDLRDRPGDRRSSIAVRRRDCMSLETARRVLRDLPRIKVDDPDPAV